MTHEIELPADVAFIDELRERLEAGKAVYLIHQGQRIGAVVPPDLIETVEYAFADGGGLPLSAEESERRLAQLAREQGIKPVTDPAQLHGPGTPEEAEELRRATGRDKPAIS